MYFLAMVLRVLLSTVSPGASIGPDAPVNETCTMGAKRDAARWRHRLQPNDRYLRVDAPEPAQRPGAQQSGAAGSGDRQIMDLLTVIHGAQHRLGGLPPQLSPAVTLPSMAAAGHGIRRVPAIGQTLSPYRVWAGSMARPQGVL